MRNGLLRCVFWAVLAGLVGWDWWHSVPINIRLEPPLLAAGSGQASSGGHCAIVR